MTKVGRETDSVGVVHEAATDLVTTDSATPEAAARLTDKEREDFLGGRSK